MNQNDASLAYRESAVRSATQVQLVVMMYDMIIEDMRQAVEALSSGAVERRTNSVKHALSVLEQLQGTLNMEAGGEAARNLDAFYSIARAKVLEAHIKRSAELMRSQASLFSDLRAAWHKIERESAASQVSGPQISEIEKTSSIPCGIVNQAFEGSASREWTA